MHSLRFLFFNNEAFNKHTNNLQKKPTENKKKYVQIK